MYDTTECILDKKYLKSKKAFNLFSEIISLIKSSSYKKVVVDLTMYKYMHPCLSVLLAAMPYIGKEYNKEVPIRINPLNYKCMDFLDKTGVLSHFQNGKSLIQIQ